MKMWRRHYAVSQIKLTCANPPDGSAVFPPKVYGNDDGIGRVPATSATSTSDVLSCPEHQLMNGLEGRHETWIDAVAPLCVPTASLQGG